MRQRRLVLAALLSLVLVSMLAVSASLGASAAPGGPTLTSKVDIDWTGGSAEVITPEGAFEFKIEPSGSGELTLLRTGAMSARINGHTATFTTGLFHDHPAHEIVANFPSSDAIRFAFGGFESIFATLDGNLNPDNDSALRAIGTLNLFRLDGEDVGSASISLQTFWPAEGGVCQIFMFGTWTES